MSAEVVKKRGRPKKVVSESIGPENLESVAKGTRQKSTKASATAPNKSTRPSATTPESSSTTSMAVQKKTLGTKRSNVVANTPPSSPAITPTDATSEPPPVPPKSSTLSSTPRAVPATSKIISQVRALSSKTPPPTKGSRAFSKPLNLASPMVLKETKSSSQINTAKPPASSPPSKSSLPDPAEIQFVSPESDVMEKTLPQPSPIASVQKSIPIAALNSSIVSQISSHAGARPGCPPTDLPSNYKPVARRVTLAIVALPIVIVTSWVLYERLVLGEERKQLVRPGMIMVEESPATREADGNLSEKGT